ncbi:hypothetical protein ABFS83_01G055200 [Erythranthe nasuta]
MAELFLQIILEKMSSLIHDEFVSITGMAKEMKKLSRTLATIQVVLEDAEMKQLKNRAIREWLVKLNDIAYEIDDILDEYITKLSKPMHGNCTLDGFNQIKFRHQIGRRMRQVTKDIVEVNAERKMFSLQEMTIERPIDAATSTIRETGSILTESHQIYGRDADAKKIVDILVNQVKENQEISVLPIIGVGGQGKTTLAQLVYNDQRVIDSFDKRIWVSVSDNFNLKTLLKAMIESGKANASDLVNLDTLQRHMWKLMNNKRYLLILDDIWNEDQDKWSELRKVLACGSTGSSIIVTTCLKKVADIMGTLPAHQLTQLSDEQCWMLLREHAFGQEKEEYPNLEAIGKQIVKKCDGVPMVTKALGGLLRYKREETEWICVKESEIWELPEEETLILPALRLSYHHLPLPLRQCFAYCAVFPKDSRIKKEELIFMWMAHGYISSKAALEVDDVGNQICDELVLRSLLQYVPDTNKTILIMHDLVHDLAESILENKIPGVQVQRKVRSVSNSKIRQVNLRKKLIAFPTSNQHASMTGINELSSAISHLKHLRHLDLSGTEIRTLPDSLCGLWNLHVLNLDECNKLVALPKKMRDLINLRHLYLENCQSLTEMPSKIGELTCLKTLSRFTVGRDRGNRLEEMQYLNLGGKLEIHHLQRVESAMDAKKANLAEKKNLRHLKLYWELYSKEENIDEEVLESLEPYPNLETLLIKGFRGRCFPVWMSNSTMKKVVRIDISFCESFMHLPRLGELPHLKTLLLSNVKVEYIIEIEEEVVQSANTLISVQQFPSLESLYLWGLPNSKGLLKEKVMRSTEAFPNLEELDIGWFSSSAQPPLSTSLKKLKKMNCGSLNLASLSKLETITDLTVHFTNTCKCITVETLQSLANLKKLKIWEADERSLPEEGMRALKSLTSLSVNYCRKLMGRLPQGWLRHLTALEELDILQCDEVVELPEEVKYLKFLRQVYLTSLPKMMSSLPEWLGDFTSLEELTISECPKVTSLPTRIRGMTNLQFMLVMECPELERRCEREIAEDWHNIQHIPHLYVGH